MDIAICYDALNVSNLASVELLARRRQLIGEAHAYNPAAPSYQGADFWLGDKFKHGGAIVAPALTQHVSKKLQAESQVLKERHKLEGAKCGHNHILVPWLANLHPLRPILCVAVGKGGFGACVGRHFHFLPAWAQHVPGSLGRALSTNTLHHDGASGRKEWRLSESLLLLVAV